MVCDSTEIAYYAGARVIANAAAGRLEEDLAQRRQDPKEALGDFCVLARVFFFRLEDTYASL
jgi:hypothetical protein